MGMRLYLIAFFVLFVAFPIKAEPPARIADLAWIVGAWEGEGIGGAPVVEVYSAPVDGKIIGHFRQLNGDGAVMFYELISIEQVGDSLSYNVKHFNADLSGWEEKADVKRFPLTAVSLNKWSFSGVTYSRIDANLMTATVEIMGDDGKPEKLDFRFRRQ